MGEAEGRKEAHEVGREGGDSAGGVHGGAAGIGRGVAVPLRDRALSALLLFLPLALWPAAGAVAAWNRGETGAFGLALGAVVLSAIPPLFTLLGYSWARKVAEAFALAGMALGILYVLRNGFTLLAVPAAGYFVVYAFLSHDRFRASGSPAKPAEPPLAEHPLAWVKENVEAIAVAFIMALVIRCFCVEVFKIPSSSMEPTLLGDVQGRGGDRIMVTKLTYGLKDVSRFEPVVFKFPLNPMKNYIKRVVGLPDELFMLFRGNVYTAAVGTTDFRIRRKSLRQQRSLWIRSWNKDEAPLLQSRTAFESVFRSDRGGSSTILDGVLTGGGSGAVSWTGAAVNDGHLGEARHFAQIVNDVMFEADLTLQSGSGRFTIRIDHDLGPFELQLSPSGGSALHHGKQVHALKTPSFPAGSAVRVEFMVFDGQAYVLFDGRVQCELIFQDTLDQLEGKQNRQGLSFGSDGLTFALARLQVGQDIHYKPKDDGEPLSRVKPLEIPPGNYFMLGDNVNNSHDGRAWRKYTVRLKSGESFEYESQSKIQRDDIKKAWAERHGWDENDLYLLIEADSHGHERAYKYDDLLPAPDGEPRWDSAPFVESRFIIGRAFAVCWPLSRCMRLIR